MRRYSRLTDQAIAAHVRPKVDAAFTITLLIEEEARLRGGVRLEAWQRTARYLESAARYIRRHV